MSEKARFVEIKGTQKRIGLFEARKIARRGTRDGLITCAPISAKAKAFFDDLDIYYVENVSLQDVLDYDILSEND
jgi:hypothetical protein